MKVEQASSILRLQDPDPSQMQIMKAYRVAAFNTHPDRGGRTEDFILVVEAKRCLLEHIGALHTSGVGRFTAADLQEGIGAFKNMSFVGSKGVHKESWYQNHIRAKLAGVGAEVYKIHGGAYQVAGIADMWVGHAKWQGWIEMKAEHGALRPSQKQKMRRLEHRCVPCVVLRGFHQMYVMENSFGEPLITRSFESWTKFSGDDLLEDLILCK